eukprot:SAG25_NODE_266_length_10666_cov_14.508943_5_plen_85_part_00
MRACVRAFMRAWQAAAAEAARIEAAAAAMAEQQRRDTQRRAIQIKLAQVFIACGIINSPRRRSARLPQRPAAKPHACTVDVAYT